MAEALAVLFTKGLGFIIRSVVNHDHFKRAIGVFLTKDAVKRRLQKAGAVERRYYDADVHCRVNDCLLDSVYEVFFHPVKDDQAKNENYDRYDHTVNES